MKSTNAPGFTLIELMIAVAIVGILASIAYPSYINQMQQSRRADCEATLMQLASAMERDFSRNNQYRDLIAAGNFQAQCPGGGTPMYALSIPAASLTATTYQLVATPQNAQATDGCGTLTLTNTLTKGQAAGKTTADCWQ